MLNKVLPYPSEQDNNFNIKVLDPTCGSGIFLVESLNRLLDRWEMAHIHQKLTFDIICQITKDNIFGIEQEKEAIKVTAFSLYLAMLNRLDPKTLWQNGRFPYLIYDPENAESEKQGHNLFRMSTISSGPFEDIEYDLVVGNPPFKRGNLEAEVKAYLTKEEFAQEAVLAFLHKAVEKLCPNGKIALVFGVKVLFNTGSLYQNFRNFLFEKTYVTEIYNFAILRKATQEEGGSLFGNASGPAGILFYNKTAPPKPAETLLYCAPKTVVKNRFMNGMAIDMTDVKYLPRTECKKPNTPIWKIAMWGTERDFSLVQNLTSEKTLLTVFEDKHWKKNAGVGFQTSKPFLYTNHEIPKLPYIDADKMERYFTSVDKTAKITDNQFSREGNLSAYKSPHLLLKAGQEKDTKKFCSSFLDYDCSFKKTIYGIHIPEGEKELKLLSAYLNSELIAYIMFLTTANWGIEREEVNPREVLRLPDLCFSLPEDKKEAIIQCVEEVIAIKKQNLAIYSIVEIEKKIDHLFYEALNLSANEQILIEDLIHLTLDGFQHKKESIAFRPTHAAEMQVYGALLSKNINNFLKFGGSLTSWVSIFPVPPSIPLNIIALRFNKAQEAGFVAETAKANVAAIMQEIAEFTYQKYAESIYYRKFVKYYSGDTIYLIKPNEKRFWSRSAALNDADEMIAEMNKRKS